MTQIVGTPYESAQYLGEERLTQEQQRNAQSIGNTYRVALAKMSQREHVTVYMGKVERGIKSTDLMVILRDCRKRVAKRTLEPADFFFFVSKLQKFSKMSRKTWISVADLLRLRQIAYGPPGVQPQPPATDRPAPAPKPGRLRQLLALDRNNRARSASKKAPRLMTGCQYPNPNSGDRCGAPCKETLCDEHKDWVPAYNGAGNQFYALPGRKEANPNRR